MSFFGKCFRFFVKLFSWSLAGALTLVLATSIILGIQLSQGPIELDFLSSHVDSWLNKNYPNYTIHYGQPVLAWDKKSSRVEFRLSNFEIHLPNHEKPLAELPAVALQFGLKSLAKGFMLPQAIEIERPMITVKRDTAGHFQVTQEDTDDDASSVSEYLALSSSSNPLHAVRELRITDLTFQYHDDTSNESLSIPAVDLIINHKKGHFDIVTRAQPLGAKVEVKSSITPGQENHIAAFKTHASISNLKVDNLAKLWPKAVLPGVRKWITENLRSGTVTQSHYDASGSVNTDSLESTLNQIQGVIDFDDVTVRYLDDVPTVLHAKGQATFNRDEVIVKVASGTSQGITVNSATVDVRDNDNKDSVLKVTIDAEGPVEGALEILDSEGLQVVRDYPINKTTAKGFVKADLNFELPLDVPDERDYFLYKADVELQDVSVKNVLGKGNYPLDLTQTNLKMTVNNKEMDMKGRGKFNKTYAGIVCHENFEQPAPFKRLYDIRALVHYDDLKHFDLPDIMDGVAEVVVRYKEEFSPSAVLHGTVDLKKADLNIPGLGSIKERGKECKGDLKITFENGNVRHIDKMILKGDQIDIDMIAKIRKSGDTLRSIHCKKLILGNTHLDFKVRHDKDDSYKVFLSGPVLDLSGLKDIKPRDDGKSPDKQQGIPLDLTLDLERVSFGEGRHIQNVKGSMLKAPEHWQFILLQGEVPGRKRGKTSLVHIHQMPAGDGHTMLIKCGHASELMRVLGITDTTRKGKAKIICSRKSPDAPWTGKAVVKRFSLADAPAVTQFLALSSPFGILEALSGHSMAFDKMRVSFKYKDKKMLIQDGRAAGPSMGFTFAGNVDLDGEHNRIQGTVLPYNLINMFLTKIPLIGDLLGGKGGGIWGVNYEMVGSFEKPNVTVNPFSALTPGFLRQIFTSEEYDQELDFGDDEDDDDDDDDDDEEEEDDDD
ncbi:MAG: DUF3971 domain-containing protein [Alphaproteobacteria bacterium]